MFKSLMIAAAAVVALSGAARAKEVRCEGEFRNQRNFGIAIENSQVSCLIPGNSKAALQINDYCNHETWMCGFFGHVSRRDGNAYVIDRITDGESF